MNNNKIRNRNNINQKTASFTKPKTTVLLQISSTEYLIHQINQTRWQLTDMK